MSNKTIPLQDLTGPYSTKRLRLPEFLDSQHMKVLMLSAGLTYSPGEISGTYFCYRL